MRPRAVLCAALFALILSPIAQAVKPVISPKTIFVKADGGFDTDITAALLKKHTPVTVMTDPAKADYVLEATGVNDHEESTGSKVARCLFMDCIGMNGNASVSVRLLDSKGAVLWAYQVRKGFSGPMARQSLSEAIAKHLREYFEDQAKKEKAAS